MIYVLFAVFMGFVGSVIFKDGLFANALSTTVVFLLLIPVIFAVGGELYKQKEEEQKRQAEFERKQRVKRGHLEDDLTPQQRILWDSLHKYRYSDVLTTNIINETKREHDQKMWSWRYNKELEYSCAMKSHFRKFGNQMSGSGNHLCNYASLLA